MAKLTFQPIFLSLSAVSAQFREPNHLIEALKEGQLVARGRFTSNYAAGSDGGETSPTYGEPAAIGVSAWRDWHAVVDHNILEDRLNLVAYNSIEIDSRELDRLRLSGRNPGGRPAEHDWVLILKQVAVWLRDNPLTPEKTLDGWIKELATGLPYCEKNDSPKEEALKDRLRDLFRALRDEEALPVGAPRRKR